MKSYTHTSLRSDTWNQMSTPRQNEIKRRRKVAKHRKRLSQIAVAALLALVLSSAIAFGWTHSATFAAFREARENSLTDLYPATNSTADKNSDGQCAIASTLDYSSDPFDSPVQFSDLDDTGYLHLINRDHAAIHIPSRSDMEDAFPSVPVANQSIGLHPTALAAVVKLLESGQSAGHGPFHLVSGFRDRARQAILYQQIADSSLVQPAGHSEHHTGLAIDIVPTALVQQADSLDSQLDGTSPDEQWLAENSWRYGLILRYPPGSQDITGISFESWHFRYVGQVHAWYMWRHDLTFEEYLQQLQQHGGFDVTIDRQSYSVRYVYPQDKVIHVPRNGDFTLSGDNTGGYIITAWAQD